MIIMIFVIMVILILLMVTSILEKFSKDLNSWAARIEKKREERKAKQKEKSDTFIDLM